MSQMPFGLMNQYKGLKQYFSFIKLWKQWNYKLNCDIHIKPMHLFCAYKHHLSDVGWCDAFALPKIKP